MRLCKGPSDRKTQPFPARAHSRDRFRQFEATSVIALPVDHAGAFDGGRRRFERSQNHNREKVGSVADGAKCGCLLSKATFALKAESNRRRVRAIFPSGMTPRSPHQPINDIDPIPPYPRVRKPGATSLAASRNVSGQTGDRPDREPGCGNAPSCDGIGDEWILAGISAGDVQTADASRAHETRGMPSAELGLKVMQASTNMTNLQSNVFLFQSSISGTMSIYSLIHYRRIEHRGEI